MVSRKDRPKEKNRQYDATYYFRNKAKINRQNTEFSDREEQKLYRKLYSRWRNAIAGNKVSKNEPFDKPPVEIRLALLSRQEMGCISCHSTECLELDHWDNNPNNNSFNNLQWLCKVCHLEKTAKERSRGLYSKYEALAGKPKWSRS